MTQPKPRDFVRRRENAARRALTRAAIRRERLAQRYGLATSASHRLRAVMDALCAVTKDHPDQDEAATVLERITAAARSELNTLLDKQERAAQTTLRNEQRRRERRAGTTAAA